MKIRVLTCFVMHIPQLIWLTFSSASSITR